MLEALHALGVVQWGDEAGVRALLGTSRSGAPTSSAESLLAIADSLEAALGTRGAARRRRRHPLVMLCAREGDAGSLAAALAVRLLELHAINACDEHEAFGSRALQATRPLALPGVAAARSPAANRQLDSAACRTST